MNHLTLFGTGSACLIFLTISGIVLLGMSGRDRRMAERIKLSQGVAPAAEENSRGLTKLARARVIGLLGQLILRTGLLSSRTKAELEITLLSAGLRGSKGLEIFIGSKIILATGLPMLTVVVLHAIVLPQIMTVALPAMAGAIGLLSPDAVVRYRRNNYLKQVARGLPDALDLLVICSQAGLGLTAAISRVADEMQQGHEAIGTELALTANELTLVDTRTALSNLGVRTGILGLTRLGTTLIQSMQYGTPLTDSIRLLSGEMRQEMLTRFEAKAARLGVMLTLPMIVFILPCVFLVVGGPAAVQIMQIGK